MACISRFATAILSGETELALGTVIVNKGAKVDWDFRISDLVKNSDGTDV